MPFLHSVRCIPFIYFSNLRLRKTYVCFQFIIINLRFIWNVLSQLTYIIYNQSSIMSILGISSDQMQKCI